MYHKKTPDENGWYWVRLADGASEMCYFTPQDNPDDLTIMHVSDGVMMPYSTIHVEAWIGPLQCPFGDLVGDCAYFQESLYLRARKNTRDNALVMTHVDLSACEHGLGAITAVGSMTHDDAYERTIPVFRRFEDNAEMRDE